MWEQPEPPEPGAAPVGPRTGESPIQTIERLAFELHGVEVVSGPTAKRRPDPKPFRERLDEIWAKEGASREPGEDA